MWRSRAGLLRTGPCGHGIARSWSQLNRMARNVYKFLTSPFLEQLHEKTYNCKFFLCSYEVYVNLIKNPLVDLQPGEHLPQGPRSCPFEMQAPRKTIPLSASLCGRQKPTYPELLVLSCETTSCQEDRREVTFYVGKVNRQTQKSHNSSSPSS